MGELAGSIPLQTSSSQPSAFSSAAISSAPPSESPSLQEPVLTTISRDLKRIGQKLWQVVVPLRTAQDSFVLREWDLWGSLLFTLVLAVTLTFASMGDTSEDAASYVFSVVFVLVITMNALLLGG